ncbi:uncharacterized protein G6M90_00g081610 [Metarhizium brunneum]|uniref:Integral membrane protein n=1 Tax=Metarhizium brunneum TaxID=500148 RepID=A0A7D5Z9U1_9HYPO
MASGAFFDPLVALRALPLVSSTCTLLFGWDQTFFLGIMNRPENRAKSKPLLQSYFNTFFYRGLPFVVGAIGVSTWSGVGNLFAQRSVLQSRQSFWWYAAGTIAAASHLLFVPLIAPSVRDMMDGKEQTDANDCLDEWLRVNNVRTLTVDLLAWGAFMVAAGKTLCH